MVLETSQMDDSTMVDDNNETTTVGKLGKASPVVVHKK